MMKEIVKTFSGAESEDNMTLLSSSPQTTLREKSSNTSFLK